MTETDTSAAATPNPGGWPEPAIAGSDAATMLGSLERQRATFAWKTSGLNAAGLRAKTAASMLTLGGLLVHLARVEETNFVVELRQAGPAAPFDSQEWADDWAWASTREPDELYSLWRHAVLHAREGLAAALADGGLDQPVGEPGSDGRRRSLRRVLADVLEEYARHTGHADLIRESIDGLVGEDPADFTPCDPWPPLSEEHRHLIEV